MSAGTPLFIYGANGYTGRLVVAEALAHGMRPVISGRDRPALERMAQELGLESRPVALDRPDALDAALQGMQVVLHCAGPFAHTARAMVDACLRTKTHYTDITGEIGVFEAVAARSAEGVRAGVTLLPGVGFDVVPSDCLAAYLHARVPGATQLTLAFMGGTGFSRGTATTMIENIGQGGAVRRNGRITRVPAAWRQRDIDYGDRVRRSVTLPWGDVSTAFHSTGIPNIDVYAAVPRGMIRSMRLARYVGWLMATPMLQRRLKARIRAGAPGPTDAQRTSAEARLWGEVRTEDGRTAAARLRTPEGYTLTALTAVAAAQRLLATDVRRGFCTPSLAFGADFICGIPGVEREDVQGAAEAVR